MRKFLFLSLLVILGCVACNNEQPKPTVTKGETPLTQQLPEEKNQPTDKNAESTDLAVQIEEHSVKIVHAKNQTKKAKLSAQNIKDLEVWWDSLPEPLQSQIEAGEVDIKLVSDIRTSDETKIDAKSVDSRIEETGKELERIIGTPTEVTYTVSTTVVGGNKKAEVDEQATSISLFKKVPVSLNEFDSQIFLRGDEVSNESIQSLQYWWLTLPTDLQNKIKRQEVTVDLACYAIDKGDLDIASNSDLGASADEFAAIMADVLDQMIGTYKMGRKTMSVGKIETASFIEKANNKNIDYPAEHYIKIRLHNTPQALPKSEPL